MTATDNAFIKVYQHEAQNGPPRPAMAHRSRKPESVVVETEHMTVSQIDASAGAIPAPTTETEVAADHSKAEMEPTIPAAERALGGRLKTSGGRGRLNSHDAHNTPSPHIDIAEFQRQLAVETIDGDSANAATRFTPAWEVDRFRWPAMCDQLQTDWAAPLTGVVRMIIREAWQGGNVVAITQFDRHEGATTLGLCLARIAASFHIRVAIIDGNLQNADLGPSLGLQFDGGWDVPTAESLEEAAIGSVEDRLVAFPLQMRDDSLATDAVQRRTLLERAAREFELVVVDAGPVFVAAHHWFSQPCIGAIGSALVVRDVRRTDQARLDDVCCRLRGAGLSRLSIVENFQPG